MTQIEQEIADALHLDEPSEAAIEAALKYHGNVPNDPRVAMAWMKDLLGVAYAIDHAAIAEAVARAIEAARKTARTYAAGDEGGLWSALAAEKDAVAALRVPREQE